MIDKIVPRKLSSSKDARVQGKDEMLDAINVTVNDSFGDFGDGQSTGDAGVIKPAKGNEPVIVASDFFEPETTKRVLGSVSDTRNNIIYFFIYSELASEQGVYCVDQFGELFSPAQNTNGQYVLHRVFTTSLFNFDSVSFIKGSIIHTSENEEGILYFTDDVNEPRKLNIKRSLSDDVPEEDVDVIDFITACPKTPIPPPVFLFGYDPLKTSTDFDSIEGYQFAYQCIYKDGEESAISTYSSLAYPLAFATQGNIKRPNLKLYNKCEITIRKFLNGIPAWTSEIKKIRLLGRVGNLGDFKTIDEKDVEGDNNVVFNFYNDEVITAIPKEDELKHFDNLPKIAKTQTVVNNRLMYGNYVDGYNDIGDVSASTNIEPVYKNFIGGSNVEVSTKVTPFMSSAPPANSNLNWNHDSSLFPPESANYLINKKPAFIIEFPNLPTQVVSGSTVVFSVSIQPDRRYDIYNAVDSFHSSKDMGLNAFSNAAFINDNTKKTSNGNPHHFQNNGGLSKPLEGDSVSWQTVYDIPNSEISQDDLNQNYFFANEDVDVAYGTSPSNALSIPASDSLYFTVGVTYLQDINSASQIANDTIQAVGAMLTGDFDNIPSTIAPFLEDDYTATPERSWEFSLSEDGSTFIPINDEKFQFINSLVRRDVVESAVGDSRSMPCGFFILKKGSVEFGLKRRLDLEASAQTNEDIGSNFLIVELDIKSVNVEEEDIYTCLPIINFETNLGIPEAEGFDWETLTWDDFFPGGDETFLNIGNVTIKSSNISFRAFSPDYIENNAQMQSKVNEINPNYLTVFNSSSEFFNAYYLLNECIYNHKFRNNNTSVKIGSPSAGSSLPYLYFENNSISGAASERFRNAGFLKLNGRPLVDLSEGYTLCDGEVNSWKGGGDTLGYEDDNKIKFGYKLEFQQDFAQMDSSLSSIAGYQNLHFIYGIVYGCDFFASSNGALSTAGGTSSFSDYPLVLGNVPWGSPQAVSTFSASAILQNTFGFDQNNFNLVNESSPTSAGNLSDFLLEKQYPEIELKSNPVINFFPGGNEYTYSSFKTNANHDFGIIYYDERGRSGFVNKLGKVFVEGYSSQERGLSGYEGPVEIKISLNHSPPPWAKHYQIAYAKNSSVSDFVFYSTGTAFVAQSQEESLDGVIYVSLNYLQQNSDVSYAEVFGGVAKDGTRDFYKFEEGDKLRVHSYVLDPFYPGGKVYPKDIEFDVLGVELLTDDDSNPLADSDGDVHPSKQGLFVKLKDNPGFDTVGFNFNSVQDAQLNPGNSETYAANENYDITSGAAGSLGSLWRRLCIVELYSPSKKRDAEERVFYETSQVYNVIESGNVLFHESDVQSLFAPEITLNDGDVYFRRVAVNYNGITDTSGTFIQFGLIEEDDAGKLKTSPNFESTYLESETFTDMFAGADVYSFGKIKTIAPNAKEIRRAASIKYSDKNSQSSSLLRFTSFNDSKFPFKDMPNESGSIQSLIDSADSVFCIQEDKCSAIPVERSLLADTLGTEDLIASIEVLGKEKVFSGNYGTDHQESVVLADNGIYFASETNYEVYRFHPSNGLEVISDQGMRSFFKDLFRDVRGATGPRSVIKVIGGFDPESEEYLLTVHNINKLVTRIEGGGQAPDNFPEGDICRLTYISSNEDGTTNWVDVNGDPALPTEICCNNAGLFFSIVNGKPVCSLTPIEDDDSGGDLPVEVLFGCMDPSANNYNPFANQDDGSCVYGPDQTCSLTYVGSNEDGTTNWVDVDGNPAPPTKPCCTGAGFLFDEIDGEPVCYFQNEDGGDGTGGGDGSGGGAGGGGNGGGGQVPGDDPVKYEESNTIGKVDRVPVFKTIPIALDYGEKIGVSGYHTHTINGIVGYMAGENHNEAKENHTEENQNKPPTLDNLISKGY